LLVEELRQLIRSLRHRKTIKKAEIIFIDIDPQQKNQLQPVGGGDSPSIVSQGI